MNSKAENIVFFYKNSKNIVPHWQRVGSRDADDSVTNQFQEMFVHSVPNSLMF